MKHSKGLRKMIAALAEDPVGYGVHMGDAVEGITVDDKRYCPQTNTSLPVRQYGAVAEELAPVAEKLLVLLEGNHDYKITARHGSLLWEIVCSKLAGSKDPDELYGTYSCKLHIEDRKGQLMYKTFLTHGAGTINSVADDPVRREANMYLSLKRKLFRKAGDCVVMAMGHTHKLLVKPPISSLYLADDGKETKQRYTSASQTAEHIDPDLRWYVNTGCFYKLYHEGVSGYAERFGYDPNELGYAVVRVKDGVVREVTSEVVKHG